MTQTVRSISAVSKIRLVMVALSMAVAWGCSRGPAIQYVEGLITLDGKPVEGAIVTYTPSGAGLGAAGTTDASGVYRLNPLTGRAGGGTLVGEYLVAVRKWEYQDPGPAPDPSDQKAYAIWQEKSLKAARQEPVYVTPQPYGDAATSGLKATVKKGRNTGAAFSFDLKSDFKGP